MAGPGEVYAQKAYGAAKVLSQLSLKQLNEYKKAIELIASKYNLVDEMISGFNAKGKLSMLEQILQEKKSEPEH